MSIDKVEIGELCNFISGGTPRRSVKRYFKGHIPWITSADLSDELNFVSSARFYITDEAIESSATKIVPKGNILLVTRTGVGKVAIADVDICISQDFTGLVPNRKKLDAKYLFHFLRHNKPYFETNARGATIQGITRRIVEELKIPLPPLAEQRRIAAVLDKAATLRSQRQQAIAKLDTLLQAVFLDMFGDPVTNPKAWEVKRLEEIGTLERGKSRHRPRNAPKLLGGPYPLIQTGDVANAKGGYIKSYSQTYSELGLEQSRMWPAGVLCITIAATIAETGILTFDACFPDSVVGFIPNELATTEYIQYWLSFLREIIEKKAPQVAQKNINLTILRALEIPVPDIEHQRKFQEIVKSIELKRAVLNNSLEHTDDLFNSLQQRAFRGEL